MFEGTRGRDEFSLLLLSLRVSAAACTGFVGFIDHFGHRLRCADTQLYRIEEPTLIRGIPCGLASHS